MIGKRSIFFIAVLLVPALICCGAGMVRAAAEETRAAPKEINIAMVTQTVLEEPWNIAMVQAFERVEKEKPNGLQLKFVVSENVQPPDAERVMRQYAKTGKYNIIMAHGGAYSSDAFKRLSKEFPDIFLACTGGGYEALGGNVYWLDMHIQEAAYLLGLIAGSMAENDVVGCVASFPVPNENLCINGYFSGARAANPGVKTVVTYIESWYDPPKAKEAALAQISAGADFIYANTYGPFGACKEKGVYAFGHSVDSNSLAPEVVVSSTLYRWDPYVIYIINQWWDHVVKGEPFNAPTDRIVFLMAEGGSDIAPYHGLESKIPEATRKKVAETRQKILDGKFKVPENEAKAVSSR